jgi:antitoxin VapB
MAFNIKNPETHALAREVADMTGESMAQAVDTALRERKARLGRKGIAAKLNAIVKVTAPRMPPGDSTTATDWLYDDKGLPK